MCVGGLLAKQCAQRLLLPKGRLFLMHTEVPFGLMVGMHRCTHTRAHAHTHRSTDVHDSRRDLCVRDNLCNQNPSSILCFLVLEAPTQRLPIYKAKFLLIRILDFLDKDTKGQASTKQVPVEPGSLCSKAAHSLMAEL